MNVNQISALNIFILLFINILFVLHFVNANNESSFKLISSTKFNSKIPVQKFVSDRTGLTVILADVEGPNVVGFILLATEALDDDGLPHTLEHAIFLGSELYPYKGVLNLLANRCLASGTNAWTDIDHTCYTMSTAGSQGFLTLLPIYLDHILYPTLTNSTFITEVHHVSGNGEDGGVVYSEMKGRENSGESRAYRQLMKAMYPGSGYGSETGGTLHNLRTSTTNQKIRDYHTAYYRPENIFIIITGMIAPEEVFHALEVVEDRIILKGIIPPFYRHLERETNSQEINKVKKQSRNNASRSRQRVRDFRNNYYWPKNRFSITGQGSLRNPVKVVKNSTIQKSELSPFQRPWKTLVPPLLSSKEFKIYYPSDEEDCGSVMIGWRGHRTESEILELTACSLILQYLSYTAISPLQREFIEINDPYASRIGYYTQDFKESMLSLEFQNVPVQKVDQIYEKLAAILNNFISGEERIDMDRMKNMIYRNIMNKMKALENYPNKIIASAIIRDCLHGNSVDDFKYYLDPMQHYGKLHTYNESFWVGLIKKYLVDGNYVLVKSLPSIEEQIRNAKEEADRIEKQRKDLGAAGLLLKEKELMEAKAINEIPPPEEMLTETEIPGIEGITFQTIRIHRTGVDRNPPGLDFYSLPIYAEAYDAPTNFVYLMVTIDTSNLHIELRPFIRLFLELLTQSPIRYEDELISYEEVVTAFQEDTVSSHVAVGLFTSGQFNCGRFSQTALISIEVEPTKYVQGVTWMTDLLYNTEFLVERIKICATKMINNIAELKRDGYHVSLMVLKALLYIEDSNVIQISFLKQLKFLTNLLELLENSETAQSVVDNLNAVRSNLIDPSNLAIHIAADWQKLSELDIYLNEPWFEIATRSSYKNGLKINHDWNLINMDGNLSNYSGSIVGMGSVESEYLIQASPSIRDAMDPDLPALMLYLQYLTQLEGPLWTQIRGQGLAYSFLAYADVTEGLIIFDLYRATNVVAAYNQTQSIIEAHLADTAIWKETLLDSAKSSLIFKIINREESVHDIIIEAFISSFMKVPIDYNRVLINRVMEVTIEDLKRVGHLYIEPMFSNKTQISIVCHPDKVDEISNGFEKMGYNLMAEKRLEDSFFGKL